MFCMYVIEMPSFELTIKEIWDSEESVKMFKLELTLFSKRYSPLAKDNIVRLMERFININQAIQNLVWIGGFVW